MRGKPRRTRFVERLGLIVEVSRKLGLGRLTRSHEKYFTEKILPKRPSKRPYVYGPEGIPLMRSTCEAISSAHQAEIEKERYRAMSDWVKTCVSPKGGFAAIPGMAPDLLHTCAALKMLRNIGEPRRSDEGTHYGWLQQKLTDVITAADVIPGRQWLSIMECIVSSIVNMELAEGLSEEQASRIAEISVDKWRESGKRIVCTNQVVSILRALRVPEDVEVFEEIRSDWLPGHEQKLALFEPDSRLQDIAGLVNIIAFLYPDNYLSRRSIKQVIDNFNRTCDRG